ncbi:pyridoxal phosphate-dependent aminotransferase family protein [soil metagenome]
MNLIRFVPMNDDFLSDKLQQRINENALRSLKISNNSIDFCSNDYLGIVKNNLISIPPGSDHGSTGSRLLTGNSALTEKTEKLIAGFHDAESALIFNSGYDANVGLLSCVPQKGDTIIYDKLSHASIRDGIRLSAAQSFSFEHNNLEDLKKKIQAASNKIFVVTESVFSMDGDIAPLKEISSICERTGAFLIVDEAHATGVFGKKGEGVVQQEGIQRQCFARIHTFGKACGVHGAAVLGSQKLRKYLMNFSRAFIYTTALPETAVAAIIASYLLLPKLDEERKQLILLIDHFKSISSGKKLIVKESASPIQAIIIPGNLNVKAAAKTLQRQNFDIRPILCPTVPKGTERLRIVLHSFNTPEQLTTLIKILES